MCQSYDENRGRPETGVKHVKTASFFIKTGFSFVKNNLQIRLRPGSARDLYGGVGMFIRRVGGTFMPRFCLFFADGHLCSHKHKKHIINHIYKQPCKKHDRCMMVGLQNFHERREVVPDSNFWCGCPEEYTISKHFR